MDEFIIGFMGEIIEEAQLLNNRRRRRALRYEDDAFELSDELFKKNFRLTKEVAQNLIAIVEPYINTKAIDLKTKVLCTLNFLATGSYQTPMGNYYLLNLSQASVSRCVDEVVDALNEPAVFNEWVHFPTSFQEINGIVSEFYQLHGFPGITGVIDCTHVGIIAPNKKEFDERAYVNRKNYHSINTQLICDARLKILNVKALYPGSSHDSFIWNNSNVLTLMERLHRAGHTQYHLIGDSGYALRPWMLTPLANPEEGTAAYRYNEALKQARYTIERCNSVLKMRFRCLLKHRILHYTPRKASKIINACAVLHNMCIMNNIENPDLGNIDPNELGDVNAGLPVPNNFPGNNQQAMLTKGRQKQYRIMKNYFMNNY